MNTPAYNNDGEDRESVGGEERENDRLFKKLKRPVHAAKRSKTPERLRGMHRRRRKRMGWYRRTDDGTGFTKPSERCTNKDS